MNTYTQNRLASDPAYADAYYKAPAGLRMREDDLNVERAVALATVQNIAVGDAVFYRCAIAASPDAADEYAQRLNDHHGHGDYITRERFVYVKQPVNLSSNAEAEALADKWNTEAVIEASRLNIGFDSKKGTCHVKLRELANGTYDVTGLDGHELLPVTRNFGTETDARAYANWVWARY